MKETKKVMRLLLNQHCKVLQKEQMMKILGGGSAYCHCYGLGTAIEVTQCSECESRCSNWGGVQNCNTIGG